MQHGSTSASRSLSLSLIVHYVTLKSVFQSKAGAEEAPEKRELSDPGFCDDPGIGGDTLQTAGC